MLLDAVRQGTSRALVVRGDAGVGKSSLLDYLELRAVGVPGPASRRGAVRNGAARSPGVHQLCAPLLDTQWMPSRARSALR